MIDNAGALAEEHSSTPPELIVAASSGAAHERAAAAATRRWCDHCGRAGSHYTSDHPSLPVLSFGYMS